MKAFSFKGMADRWPSSHVARERIGDFTGGLVNPKYLANLDSQGLGPGGRFRVGRKVVYPVQSVIQWLENRAEVIK